MCFFKSKVSTTNKSMSLNRKRRVSDEHINVGYDVKLQTKRVKKQVNYRNEQTHPSGIRNKKKDVMWPLVSKDKERMEHTIWIDEAGMGSWAGPLHVAGTYILPGFDIKGIHDSKLLKIHERELLYMQLLKSPNVIHHVESITNVELDKVGGLGVAWRIGIRRVIDSIKKQVQERFPDVELTTVVLDGNKGVDGTSIPVVPVTKADQKHVGVGAASILAKVSRDQLMVHVAHKYPEFEDIFIKGKGYWFSQTHSELVKSGVYTDLHRKTYRPLKDWLNGQNKFVTQRILNKDS